MLFNLNIIVVFVKVFKSMDLVQSYPALFQVLWHSINPCFDIRFDQIILEYSQLPVKLLQLSISIWICLTSDTGPQPIETRSQQSSGASGRLIFLRKKDYVNNDDDDDVQGEGLDVHLLLRVVVPLVSRLHRVVTHGEASGKSLLHLSWSSLGQGRTQIWKRPIIIGLGVTEYVEIASMMFCECCNYFTRWYPARQGELNIEANTNAALRSSVRHFHFLSVLSVCYHICLFVCQPVCFAAVPSEAR